MEEKVREGEVGVGEGGEMQVKGLLQSWGSEERKERLQVNGLLQSWGSD